MSFTKNNLIKLREIFKLIVFFQPLNRLVQQWNCLMNQAGFKSKRMHRRSIKINEIGPVTMKNQQSAAALNREDSLNSQAASKSIEVKLHIHILIPPVF